MCSHSQFVGTYSHTTMSFKVTERVPCMGPHVSCVVIHVCQERGLTSVITRRRNGLSRYGHHNSGTPPLELLTRQFYLPGLPV